jgi:hypothetical protein
MTSTKGDPDLRAALPAGITSAVGGSLVRWLFQVSMVVFVITIGLAKCLSGLIWDELAAARRAG